MENPTTRFTDTTGIQHVLNVSHGDVMNFIDNGMPCLPAPNGKGKGKGVRFDIAACEAWVNDYLAVAHVVSERLGWNLIESKEWAVYSDLVYSIDDGGNAIVDDDDFAAALRRSQEKFAAKHAADLAKKREEEARNFSDAGSTEPAEHLELAA